MSRYPDRKILIEEETEIIINGDKILLQLAINNLLDNAIKYSEKDDVVLVKISKANRKVNLKVIDQGVGIKDSEKKRIFEKYFRGSGMQAKGTGLGLYLTREIIKQHHGIISFRNNEYGGSTFEIQLKTAKKI